MAEITKELGRIPVTRGEYEASITYYKNNIVQYKRGSYQVVSESPIIGVPPTNDKNIVNPGWILFAGTLDAQDIVNQIKEQEIKSIQAVADREAEILTKSDAAKVSFDNTGTSLSGTNVQDALEETDGKINQLKNAGYFYAGIATPTTNPGTPEGHVFYIANGKGTYTNFGGIDVTEDEVVILYYDTVWHKEATGIASQDKLTELEKIWVDKVNRVNSNLQITNLTQVYKIPSNFVPGKYIFEKNKEIKLYIESDEVISDGFTPYVRTGETLEPMCQPGQGKPNKIISYNPTIDVEYIHIFIPPACVIKNGTINISAQQTVSIGLNKDIENLMNDVTIIQNDVTSVEKELVDINDTLYGNEGREIDITDVLGMPIDGFWYNKNIGSTFTEVLDATSDGIHYEKIDTTDYASIKIVVENGYGNRAVILCDEKNIVLASYKWGDHTEDKTIVVDTTNGKWLYISTNKLSERGTLEVTAIKKPSKGLVDKVLSANVSKMYVAPNGNDKNEGSVDSPLATINKAIESGASCILLADGVYEQKINFLGTKVKTISIMPSDIGIIPIIKSPNRLRINDGSETLVSGKIKTYHKVIEKTISAAVKWIYQEGINDITTLVNNDEKHPLQRGLMYRCENTCITLTMATSTTSAIEEIESSEDYKWFFDNETNTLYFSRPQMSSQDKPIVIPLEGDNIFENIPQGLKVDMSGINIWYMKGNFFNMCQPNIVDCSVKYSCNDGFGWNNTIGATFNHCEACRCQFYNNGDGFNAHSTYTSGVNPYAKYTTATLIDCWAHDIYDDGYSDHERCEVQIHGGLFEYCGKGGLTPANGTHCICYNVLSRKNYRGFYMAGVVAEEGGNGGQLMCYNCISENNYVPSVNENMRSTINGSEGSGFHCSGNVNSMILYNCVSIGNNIGYRTDSNAVAMLIDCRTKGDTTAKNIGETSVVNNTNTL